MATLSKEFGTAGPASNRVGIRNYLEEAGVTTVPPGIRAGVSGVWNDGPTPWTVNVAPLSRSRYYGPDIRRRHVVGYRLTMTAPLSCPVSLSVIHRETRGLGWISWLNRRRGMKIVPVASLSDSYELWCSDVAWANEVFNSEEAVSALNTLVAMDFVDPALGHPFVMIAHDTLSLFRRARRQQDIGALRKYLCAAAKLRQRVAAAPAPREPVTRGWWARVAKRHPLLAGGALVVLALSIPSLFLLGLLLLLGS